MCWKGEETREVQENIEWKRWVVLYWGLCSERESWDIENVLTIQLYSLYKRECYMLKEGVLL